MLSKNQVKKIQALSQKKVREESGLFVAEGVKLVKELLSSSLKLTELYALPEFLSNCKEPVSDQTEVYELSKAELERVSFLSTPNEVMAICKIPERTLTVDLLQSKLTLVLDDIRDPGNLGTIVRIADWFGIETIVCSHETVDVYNPKVVQATMGSIARVAVYYADLVSFIADARTAGIPVFGAMLDGQPLYETTLPSSGIIVIGNEARGISDPVAALLTAKLRIPSYGNLKSGGGEAESLNAAIATAILCAEFRRVNQ